MHDEKKKDAQQGEVTTEKKWTNQKTWNVVGIVLCVLLLPVLVINCILIVQGLFSDKVPSLGGNTPLIVLTESMEDTIMGGDLIIVKKVDPKDIKPGDIISFFDPASNNGAVVTHRVLPAEEGGIVYDAEGKLFWNTKGDNNPTADKVSVPAENLVGRYEGTRIAFLGSVAMFMQSTWGLIVCIGVPLAALVTYELLRYKKANKAKQEDVDSLKTELAALKAAQEKKEEDSVKEEEKSE